MIKADYETEIWPKPSREMSSAILFSLFLCPIDLVLTFVCEENYNLAYKHCVLVDVYQDISQENSWPFSPIFRCILVSVYSFSQPQEPLCSR